MTSTDDLIAPERIWATVNGMRTSMPGIGQYRIGGWAEFEQSTRAIEYVRADRLTALQDRVKELEGAFHRMDAFTVKIHDKAGEYYSVRAKDFEEMWALCRAALAQKGE